MKWYEWGMLTFLAVFFAGNIVMGAVGTEYNSGPLGFGTLSGTGGKATATRPRDRAIFEGISGTRIEIVPGSKKIRIKGGSGGHAIKNSSGITMPTRAYLRYSSPFQVTDDAGADETRFSLLFANQTTAGLMSAGDKTKQNKSANYYIEKSTVNIQLTASYYANDGTIYGATTNTLVKSTDGGANWTTLKTFSTNALKAYVLYVAANGYIYAAFMPGSEGSLAAGEDGLWRSIDDGATWSNVLGPTQFPAWPQDCGLLNITEDSSGNLFTATYTALWVASPANYAHVFKSTDDGANWTDITPTISNARKHFHDIECDTTTDTVYLCVGEPISESYSAGDELVVKTSNGGTSWSNVITWDSGSLPNYPTFNSIPIAYVGDGFRLFSYQLNGELRMVRTTNDSSFTTVLTKNVDSSYYAIPFKTRKSDLSGYLYSVYKHSPAIYVGSADGTTWDLLEQSSPIFKQNMGWENLSNFYNNSAILSGHLSNPSTSYWSSLTQWEVGIKLTEKDNHKVFISNNMINPVSEGNDHNHTYGNGGPLVGTPNEFGIGTLVPGYKLHTVEEFATPATTNITAAFDVYGDTARYIVRSANGTEAAPTQKLSGENIGVIGARSYHSGGAFSTGSLGGVTVYATQDHTATALGTGLRLFSTPDDATTATTGLVLDSTGKVGIGSSFVGATRPTEKLEVDGNVKATAFIGDGSQLTGIPEFQYKRTISLTTNLAMQSTDLNGIVVLSPSGTNEYRLASGTGTAQDTVLIYNSSASATAYLGNSGTTLDGSSATVTIPPDGFRWVSCTAANTWVTSGKSGSGTTDHNALTNLTTGDVHTHYALLAGRSGTNDFTGQVTATTKIGIGIASPTQVIHAATTGSVQMLLNTTDTTTSSSASVNLTSDASGGSVLIAGHGSARTVTQYGITLGGYGEIRGTAINGLIIGTSTNATPIIFGTNSAERLRIQSNGVQTTNQLTSRTSASKVLTDDTSTSIIEIALTDGQMVCGWIEYCAHSTDGTDMVIHRGRVSFAATSKSGTQTADIAHNHETGSSNVATGGATFVDNVSGSADLANAGGWGIQSGTGKITLKYRGNASITSTGYPLLKYTINLQGTNTMTPL